MADSVPFIDLEAIQARREQERVELRRSGVDEALISTLVETFYGRVQSHPELGPIFGVVLDGKWDLHLEKMKKFWSSVILKTNVYEGQPMKSHMALKGVRTEHFEDWMSLFQSTAREVCPSEVAAMLFIERAEKIAARLKSAMKLQ